jgi:pilus assembly protein CpaF
MLFRPQKSSGDHHVAPAPPSAKDSESNASNLTDIVAESQGLGQDLVRNDTYIALKVQLHQKLLENINFAAIDKLEPHELKLQIGEMVHELLAEEQVPLNMKERNQLVSDIIDETLGLGPIEPLIKDPTVSDILINTDAQVYVERKGMLELTPVRFKDAKHLVRIIEKIVSSVGRRIDESSPMVDARLKDGSRVNAIIPPLAVDGPLVSIRKFGTMRPTMENLISANSLTAEIADLLRAVVACRLNVIISGGTGSGKTTMLNAMSSYIGEAERIVTIEDAAELQLQQPHVVRLETRPPNIEGRGEVTQRDLVKNSLRMRPDRIVLGEVRSGEAFDMLQAMNTGHDGSMTTVHANTCRDAVTRIEQMVAMAGLDLPVSGIRANIAAAVDVILQLERMSDGGRRLTSLHEITGMEGDVVSMQEIFTFRRVGTDADGRISGEFRCTGIRPKFTQEFATRGITVDEDLFSPDRLLG